MELAATSTPWLQQSTHRFMVEQLLSWTNCDALAKIIAIAPNYSQALGTEESATRIQSKAKLHIVDLKAPLNPSALL